MQEPLYDASSQEQERQAIDLASRNRRADADVLRKIMFTRDGRAWLYRLLESCNIYGSSFSPGQPDVTAFSLGQENIGRKLMLDAMEASTDLYVKMIAEQREEAQRLMKVRAEDERKQEAGTDQTVGGFIDLPPPEGWDDK
jgi:hypothetical protein